MNDVRGFAHDWKNVSRIGNTTKRAPHRCAVCGMHRRWSPVFEKFAYYRPGFIGHRPGRCLSKGRK